MTQDKQTYFTKQNDKEKQSKLGQVGSNSLEVTVWEKGSTIREKFTASEFHREDFYLILNSTVKSDNSNKGVLYSFSINGVNFFGKGDLKELQKNRYHLSCLDDLYKSERRENFRLLTYPHHDAYIQIPVEESEEEASNVVDFKTKVSQTGLFKNFLDIVGDEESNLKDGFVKFRVLDVSVTGLAFQIGEIEKEFIEKQQFIEPAFVFFKEELEIPKIEIRYIVPLIQRSGRAYKVGVKFIDIDTNIDLKLGNLINNAMRDFESEFEDFI